MFMENNIIANITDRGNHVFVEDGGTAGASLLEHACLPERRPDRIRWGTASGGLPALQRVRKA